MLRALTTISIILLTLVITPNISSADYKLYPIDNVYNAPFPDQPTFVGEIGQGKGKHRSYQYSDDTNIISYSATYQVNSDSFKTKDIHKIIKKYIDGVIIGSGGKLLSTQPADFNGYKGIKYVSEKNYDGVIAKKHGIVIFKNDRFHMWSVSDFQNKSKESAERVFNFYYKYITIN